MSDKILKKYLPIIGLEIHVELKTKTKMFCRCLVSELGEKPNTRTCPVCLGLPGSLPYPNKKAIEWCLMIGMALNCKEAIFSKFDRKNYFYPDLPKGYQISQYDLPFSKDGFLNIENKRIGITRVHMEEDTGKILHEQVEGKKVSLLDFNRSGVPLVEIVTKPDINYASEAKNFLIKLQRIIKYLGVSDANMEKGQMRLEPNISLRSNNTNPMSNDVLPDYKVEVKNINSFKFVEKAIDYEIKRQMELLEKGEKPKQETRGWDETKQKTFSQRAKEEANDYRYFPDPDNPPIRFTQDQIEKIKGHIGEMPDEKLQRFKKEYALSDYDAEIITRERNLADYFEEAVRVNNELKIKNQESTEPKNIANWIINKKINTDESLPAELIQTIINSRQKTTIDEEELNKIVTEVLQENPKAVEDFKSGKREALMFLLGQTMRKLGKKVDTATVKAKIQDLIEKI